MRTWLLVLAALLFVSFYTAPGYAADPSGCDLIMKIQKYISQTELVAMFGPSESGRTKNLAKLKKQFTKALAELKDRAAKDKGVFKTRSQNLKQIWLRAQNVSMTIEISSSIWPPMRTARENAAIPRMRRG
jgi:hypothetical protein